MSSFDVCFVVCRVEFKTGMELAMFSVFRDVDMGDIGGLNRIG
jgi:hypothetical protein